MVTERSIASKIEKKTGISQKDVLYVITEFVVHIKQELLCDNEVRISKFGRFYVNKRSEREGYDPARKVKIPLGVSKNPAFRDTDKKRLVRYLPSQSFKEDMRKKVLKDEGYSITL